MVDLGKIYRMYRKRKAQLDVINQKSWSNRQMKTHFGGWILNENGVKASMIIKLQEFATAIGPYDCAK